MVWQASGMYRYGLDEYVRDGHARLRGWDEMGHFVADFEQLTSHEVSYRIVSLGGRWSKFSS